jgi:hypothetical protein
MLVLYALLISLTVVLVRFLMGLLRSILSAVGEPLPTLARPLALSSGGDGRHLDRNARGYLAARGPLAAPDRRGWSPVPEARPDPLFDLRGNLHDAPLTTLRVQGLSLPALVRGLEDDGTAEREEVRSRIEVAESALARLQELAEEKWAREDMDKRVRGLYNCCRSRFVARFDGGEKRLAERSIAYQRLIRELLRSQRHTLLRLRDQGKIGDEAMHRIEHDLDLEESRLEVTSRQTPMI